MEQDREAERRRYALCRAAFMFMSAALVVACVTNLLFLPVFFGGRPIFPRLLRSWIWHWADTPVVWFSLVGAYLLWGRWTHPSWQRRTGLLVVLNLIDVILWFTDHGAELGMRIGEVPHEWVRTHLGQALGWAEFALIAAIASDILVHLGVPQAAESSRATRSLAATGAVLWMILFVERTNWRHWPLGFNRGFNLQTMLLMIGWNMIWTIVLIQVTALTIAAARQCGEVLAEMAREDLELDTFRSPSDTGFASLVGPDGAMAE